MRLRGWLSRRELARLYSEASGFIHIGEEDFGISMVEALASGTPVIALNRGGARDIVRDGIDGVLIDEPSIEALRQAISDVTSAEWKRAALVERAHLFSRETFVSRLREHMNEVARRGREQP